MVFADGQAVPFGEETVKELHLKAGRLREQDVADAQEAGRGETGNRKILTTEDTGKHRGQEFLDLSSVTLCALRGITAWVPIFRSGVV